jgi:hypothetical protein
MLQVICPYLTYNIIDHMLRYTYTLFFTEHTFLLNFMLAHFRDDAWNLYQWEFVEHYQFLSEAEKNKLVIN